MNAKTRILPALLLAAALLPASVRAATSGPYTYTVADNKATITEFDISYSGAVSITNELGGYPVTSIGDSAFFDCKSLTSVTIPASVTSIGDSAFYFCESLTSITIPDSVTSIGDKAFYVCNSLTSATIGNSVESIGDSAFYNTPVASVTIGNSVTSIGVNAFRLCPLTTVTIPASVTSIGNSAFNGCTNLTSVTIPASVTSIGNNAFSSPSITAINVAENNPNYTSIDGVLFNKDLTTLIQRPPTFSGHYTITNSVTSIGEYAFAGCNKITSVTIPASVTSIGDYAFYNCTSITAINVSENNPNYTSIDGVLFEKGVTDLIQCPAAFSGGFTIPASVTNICDAAFRDCTALTCVYVQGNAPSYGSTSFENTPATVYYFPDTDGWINPFAGRPARLLPLEFANGGDHIVITRLGSAFAGHLPIPASLDRLPVTSIGPSAFNWCKSLTSVTIPASVTSIGDSAFSYCFALTAVTIPGSVTSIGSYAFSFCMSLASVTIPGSVTSIGDGAFAGCWSLSSVSLPGGVTNIGASAFANCNMLSSVVIPDTVDSIGDQAFEYCYTLAAVLFTGNVPSSLSATAFDGISPTIYYLPGATGWDAPVNFQFPVCWAPPAVSTASSPRFTSGAFAFTLVGNANLPVRIEACDSLASPSWSTVTDTTLDASGTLDFSDPDASSHASRFYRVSFPK